jgi:hypothetical protein
MKTYFWDFFGPNAEGTARHFVRHLEQFLAEHQVEGCSVDASASFEGHFAATCLAPEAAQPVIEGSLRPNRAI